MLPKVKKVKNRSPYLHQCTFTMYRPRIHRTSQCWNKWIKGGVHASWANYSIVIFSMRSKRFLRYVPTCRITTFGINPIEWRSEFRTETPNDVKETVTEEGCVSGVKSLWQLFAFESWNQEIDSNFCQSETTMIVCDFASMRRGSRKWLVCVDAVHSLINASSPVLPGHFPSWWSYQSFVLW